MELMLYAAAKAGPPIDLTPFVGIIGAVIGATIALLGQRMNIKEQRRKDLRERVVDFLRAADQLSTTAQSYLGATCNGNIVRARELLIQMRSENIDIDYRKQYLDLTASFVLRHWVDRLHTTVVELNDLALQCQTPVEATNAADAVEINKVIEAKFKAESTEYDQLRNKLVHHVRPDIDIVPLWATKPWYNIIRFLLRPFNRKPKEAPAEPE